MTRGAHLPARLVDGSWERPLEAPGSRGPAALWLVRAHGFRDVVARFAGSVLDDGEKERAATFRMEADRDTYLAGHVGLRLLLGAYLAVPPSEVPLDRLPCVSCGRPHGRPVVRGNPLHFSLSHSRGLCLMAFAPAAVGVDVEAVPDPDVVAEVGVSLHPRETAELSAFDASAAPAAFARAWARKEAYLKGIGSGLGRSPSLDYLGTRAGAVAAPPGWTVGDVAVGDGHAAAVAVAVRDADATSSTCRSSPSPSAAPSSAPDPSGWRRSPGSWR